MAVSGIEIRSRVPYEGGVAFGATGPYERLDGVVHFAVDPTHPANAAIVDLELAERQADGLVHFAADFCLLQPLDPTRSNQRLLFHVANRGRLGTVPFNNAPPPAALVERIDPGDGWLMHQGWTVLWGGWQWDVVRRPGLVGLEAPLAMVDGQPLSSPILLQFQPNELHPDEYLAHWPLHPVPGNPDFTHRPYPAADLGEPTATLTVRATPDGPRTVIPRDQWRFARDEGGQPVPDETRIWLSGGFQPGLIYEVIYRTRLCPVTGTGFLAMRDLVAFVRRASAAEGNPCTGRLDYAFGFGVSQCGRFLRDFLYHGLNLDEAGRPVFDGLIPHVAGARRGEFNFRGAQPSAQHVRNLAHRFPFADVEQTDPQTGERDGLLSRQRALGGMPRIFTINTSSEYWRIDCSLIHTDVDGQRDVEPPDDVRIYTFAGTQHGPGLLPLSRETPAGARLGNWANLVNYSPLLRAALHNLERWVTADEAPPASVFPRLADGTAVPREQVLRFFAELPATELPTAEVLPSVRRVLAGPAAATGGEPLPLTAGAPYPSFVSAVDASGNEIAGIRLPDLSVPLGSHTGWNPRAASIGGAGQVVDMLGSTIPLPRTDAEQQRNGDPRQPISRRYRDRDDYLTQVRAAAAALVAQRHLLAEDVELVVQHAAERYAALTAPD